MTDYSVWGYSIISVVIVSIISLIGVLTFSLQKKMLKRVLMFFVSFSAGALFGGAFLHLLPEVLEEYGIMTEIFIYVLIGMLLFFVLEKFIHWRHCHVPTSKQHPHHLALMNLIGDGMHNLIDGMIIGGSYLVSIPLGISTTIAIVLHEIPQEMGDFGVLLYSGMSKAKALLFNFLTALTAVIGVVLSLTLGQSIENYALFLLPITAGGFIYIAGSDLIPEMHKECRMSFSLLQFVSLILGIVVMLLLL